MNTNLSRAATALLIDYACVYYIDPDTGHYDFFCSDSRYDGPDMHNFGEDFFADCENNIMQVVYEEDQEMVAAALTRENMLRRAREDGAVLIVYRLVIDGAPVYHRTRIVLQTGEDAGRIVLGIQNIDDEVKNVEAMEEISRQSVVFYQIAESLANQYDTIYYVDMLTNEYIEFASTDVYKSLDVMPVGDNFFVDSEINIDRVIHPEDRAAFRDFFNKAAIISALEKKHMITHNYRLLIRDTFMYARVSIIWASDKKHVIIGIMNIDQEIRREQEIQKKLNQANRKAYRDQLTGTGNKAAFTEWEDTTDERIRAGDLSPFSIVVCDVNGLKEVNDRQGHKQGDDYIRSASALICRNWAHSPVFRIGGDEFVITLEGDDYEHRQALLAEFRETVLASRDAGGVSVAAGMADFLPGTDASVSAAFERADSLMYEDKSALKAGR